MKKPALLVLGVLLFLLLSIYFVIPQFITTTSIVKIDATDVLVSKFLVKKPQWHKWWPGRQSAVDSNVLIHNGVTYTLQKATNSGMQVAINMGDRELISDVTYLATDDGVCTVSWIAQKQSSINPFTRVSEFIKIRKQAKDLTNILAGLKQYIHQDVNVYGIKLGIEKIKVTTILATNSVTSTYPTVEQTYKMVNLVKKEIAAQNAQEVDLPMLNVTQGGDNEYHVMVGIPVNKKVKPTANTIVTSMVLNGNMVVTQVSGGRGTLDHAFEQIKNYQKEHRLVAVAKPFEQLITDRRTEKDTANWVTKLAWPVY